VIEVWQKEPLSWQRCTLAWLPNAESTIPWNSEVRQITVSKPESKAWSRPLNRCQSEKRTLQKGNETLLLNHSICSQYVSFHFITHYLKCPLLHSVFFLLSQPACTDACVEVHSCHAHEQVTQRNLGCHIIGSVQGQVRWALSNVA